MRIILFIILSINYRYVDYNSLIELQRLNHKDPYVKELPTFKQNSSISTSCPLNSNKTV